MRSRTGAVLMCVVLLFIQSCGTTSTLYKGGNAPTGEQVMDYLQGRQDGERDAEANPLWGVAGLGCGVFAPIGACFTKPRPRPSAIAGKSAAYALGYEEAYEKSARRQNVFWACGGWLVSVMALVVVSASQ